MKVYRDTNAAPQDGSSGRSIAIGIFDGVHRGHQELVNGAIAMRQRGRVKLGHTHL